MANWAKGIQMYNISADADASVEMRIWCQIGMNLDVRKFPPDVIMLPEVTQANLDITDFRLHRVSKLDGPIVKQLSGSVHKILLDKIEEKRDGLPNKINREIAKNQDKMRLSLSDFASSKWESLTSGTSSAESVEASNNAPVGGVTMRGTAALSEEAARARAARLEADRVEAVRLEAARIEAARLEELRLEAARVEAARVEAARLEEAKAELARIKAAEAEAARNPSRLRSVLIRPSMQVSTLTKSVAKEMVEPEFVPAAKPIARRIGDDVGPTVELLDLVPLAE